MSREQGRASMIMHDWDENVAEGKDTTYVQVVLRQFSVLHKLGSAVCIKNSVCGILDDLVIESNN